MARLQELLPSLAEAGVGALTRRGLARQVARALADEGVEELAFGWHDGARTHEVRARRRGPGWEVAETEPAPLDPQRQLDPLFIPFAPPVAGYLELRVPGPPPPTLTGEALVAVARVLRVAHRHCALVGRVAGASRDAHAARARLQRQVDGLRAEPTIVAQSHGMRTLLQQLDAVADHDTSVLLLGESGTGKSVLARRVHARSPRAGRPFVEVNCAALPDALLESELFGHAAGAFTGAQRAHRGRFERADGGTLFLDEVAELPLSAQAKLLRALQDGVVEPLGAEREVRVDVRIVAATHQPLARRVAEGAFREDLYYRLDVFPLTVPPLRARRHDMPELVRALLAEIGRRLHKPTPRLTPEVLHDLLQRPWPGNVRELANVLERAAILSGATLELEAATPDAHAAPLASPKLETFDALVRAGLERALARAGGKLYGPDGAAAALDLPPSTLQTKLRKLGIDHTAFRNRAD